MKSIVLSVLMCLAMSLGIQAKAAAGQIDQAIDQKVTQVVKDKVWKLKADMVFLSGGKTEALPSDSCFMEVNGAEAAVCLPYLSGEQDGERVNLQGWRPIRRIIRLPSMYTRRMDWAPFC